MNIKLKNVLFFLALLCSFQFTITIRLRTALKSRCTCEPEEQIPQELDEVNVQDFKPEDEIINSINYGKPVYLQNGIVLLEKDITITPHIEKMHVCPPGWRVPTRMEMKRMMNTYKEDTYEVLTKQAGFDPTRLYVLEDKRFKKFVDPKNSKSFVFKGVQLNSDEESVRIMNINTDTDKLWAKCILNVKDYQIKLRVRRHFNGESLTLNKYYNAYLKDTNIVSRVWKYNGRTSNSTLFPVRFLQEECNTIYVFTKHMNGDTKSSCHSFYVYKNDTSEAQAQLSIDKIDEVVLNQTAMRFEKVHFSPGTTPFTPTHDGGLLLLYTHKTKQLLRAIEFDDKLRVIRRFPLDHAAYAMDIIHYKNGYVLLCRGIEDENLLFLLAFDKNFMFQWRRTIMNNKVNPTSAEKDQIIFHKSLNETEFGMNSMFKAQSGRLSYIDGRIAVMFSHFNYFGNTTSGKRNDHTGDSIITFDDQGNNPQLISGWGTSPSLSQSIINNGNNTFISASLGGEYPKNIRVTAAKANELGKDYDPITKRFYKHLSISKEHFIPGDIPADGYGHSCGRLGGLVGDNAGKNFGLVYSRKACNITGYKNISSHTGHNEFGVIFFDEKLNQTKQVVLGDGSHVISIKTARYGNNILILYGETFENFTKDETLENTVLMKNIKVYAMLIDFTGRILFKPTLFQGKRIPTTDDIKTLKDGSAAWTSVDSSGKIHVFKASAYRN